MTKQDEGTLNKAHLMCLIKQKQFCCQFPHLPAVYAFLKQCHTVQIILSLSFWQSPHVTQSKKQYDLSTLDVKLRLVKKLSVLFILFGHELLGFLHFFLFVIQKRFIFTRDNIYLWHIANQFQNKRKISAV